MPEYLAPGVYVEEVSFRAKSIEGVSTTTTGFVGPARYGPIDIEPEIITSLVEYERIYGDRQPLVYDGGATSPNFLWHAVRAFFEEGGKRLYVARIFSMLGGNTAPPYSRPGGDIDDDTPDDTDDIFHDGHARAWLTQDPGVGSRDNSILMRARFPGASGNRRVRITVTLGQNMLSGTAGGLARARSAITTPSGLATCRAPSQAPWARAASTSLTSTGTRRRGSSARAPRRRRTTCA